MSDLFESPEIMLAGLEMSLKDILELIQQHKAEAKFKVELLLEQSSGETLVCISPVDPPNMIRAKAASALNEIRHSLDQAVWAASMTISKSPKPLEKTYFPFCQDKNDFDALATNKRGRIADVPAQLIPYLKSLEPWWFNAVDNTGDDMLRALGYYSGPNKHQMLIKTVIDASGIEIETMSGCSFVYPLTWDEELDRLVLCRTKSPNEFKFNARFPVDFTFGNLKGLGRQPVATVLENLTRLAQGIVLGIKEETKNIMSA